MNRPTLHPIGQGPITFDTLPELLTYAWEHRVTGHFVNQLGEWVKLFKGKRPSIGGGFGWVPCGK